MDETQEPVQCRRCRRKLRTANARAAGIGPVCGKREIAMNADIAVAIRLESAIATAPTSAFMDGEDWTGIAL